MCFFGRGRIGMELNGIASRYLGSWTHDTLAFVQSNHE